MLSGSHAAACSGLIPSSTIFLVLPRARRHQLEGRVGSGNDRQRPLQVRRQREGVAFAEADHGRPVRLAEEDGVVGAAGFPLFVEEERLAVRGEVGREGVVEKGHVALALVAREDPPDAHARALARQEHAAALRDVVQLQAARHARHDAQLSRQRHRVERPVGARLGRAEPDLLARRSPREAVLARPLAGQRRLLSREVDDRDRAGVVEREGMVEKGDAVALGREPRVADVPRRLVEHLSHRELDARLAADVAHDEELRAVGRPVRVLDAVGHVAGRAARQRRPRELAGADAGVRRAAVRARSPSRPWGRCRGGSSSAARAEASRGSTGA